MSSDPQSIASIIEGQHQHEIPLGAAPGGDEDQAALLTYLKTHYSDPIVNTPTLGASEIPPLPSTSFRQTPIPTAGADDSHAPSHDYSRYTVRAASPVNESISIPASLAELAATSSITVDIPSYASDFHERYLDQAGDAERGEMGGKRRKQPHERAGWKEMDEAPQTKRRRGKGRPARGNGGSGGVSAGAGLSGDDAKDLTAAVQAQHIDPTLSGVGVGASLGEMAAIGNHPQEAMQAGPEMSGTEGAAGGGGAELDPALQSQQLHAEAQAPELDSKESRAAQNRRAQQVFRRKREEHMKKLEADSAGFKLASHNLHLSEARLRQLALQLEAEHIEKTALRLALRNVSQSQSQAGNPVSILDAEGSLVMQPNGPTRQGITDTPEELDRAFATLEAQSRELAKTNRSRRV